MISIGDYDREVDLATIISNLLGTTKTIQQSVKGYNFDESEVEEIQAHLAGEIEQCTNCKKWSHSYDIDVEGHCDACQLSTDFQYNGQI